MERKPVPVSPRKPRTAECGRPWEVPSMPSRCRVGSFTIGQVQSGGPCLSPGLRLGGLCWEQVGSAAGRSPPPSETTGEAAVRQDRQRGQAVPGPGGPGDKPSFCCLAALSPARRQSPGCERTDLRAGGNRSLREPAFPENFQGEAEAGCFHQKCPWWAFVTIVLTDRTKGVMLIRFKSA